MVDAASVCQIRISIQLLVKGPCMNSDIAVHHTGSKIPSIRSRSLLLICFHFPPVQGGSGVHRITAWCKYLAQMGWDITILTVTPNAHVRIRKENFNQIPPGIRVLQAPAIDAARHLSLWKRYPGWAAIPDRWQSWILSGIFTGIRYVRKNRPELILSTAPIVSAHAIALGLKTIFGMPWVADFRDPITGVGQESSHLETLSRQWVEKRVFDCADHVTVTTPGTLGLYQKKYGQKAAPKITIIENGFDPDMFVLNLQENESCQPPDKQKPLIFLHSGLIYSKGRNPENLFEALAILRDQGKISEEKICFVFRASGFSQEYIRKYHHLNLGNLVRFEDVSLSHEKAIEEMRKAHALVVFQGSVFNAQIPAKVYEYIAVGKPILGVVDPKGDTAKFLNQIDTGMILDMNDAIHIQENLPKFVHKIHNNEIPAPDFSLVQTFSRKSGSLQLNNIMEGLITMRKD